MKYLRLFCTIIIFILCTQPLTAQQKNVFDGNWKGELYQDNTLMGKFKTHFTHKKDHLKGTFNIQGRTVPFKTIRLTKADSVFLYIVKGMNGKTHFKGVLKNDSLITGKMFQKGFAFPFNLKRSKPTTTKKAAKPYHHRKVIIKHDSIKIGGTLTWPKKQPAHQLVIMITGSGPQNRNEEMHGINEFGPIADYLTRHHIATYRYDDRGVGESTGNYMQSSISMLVSDVKSIIAHFSKSTTPHFNKFILLGHSQGGEVAGMAAAEDSLVSQLILMSSPSIAGYKVLNYQLRENFSPFNMQKAEIDKTINAFDNVMTALRDSKNVTSAKKIYQQQFSQMMKTLPDSTNSSNKKFIKELGDGLLQLVGTPIMRSDNFYDPANDLRKLNIPVLALFSGKDGKVPIRKNLPPMAAALDSAGVSYQINVFKNADHSYVRKKARNIHYHSKPEEDPFVKGFLPTLTNWIRRYK